MLAAEDKLERCRTRQVLSRDCLGYSKANSCIPDNALMQNPAVSCSVRAI